jgi:Holliday junction resolvase RusA-like endonuclease
MGLDVKFITVLADATKSYFDNYDLKELCDAFEVHLFYGDYNQIAHLAWARSIIQNVEHGNNRGSSGDSILNDR